MLVSKRWDFLVGGGGPYCRGGICRKNTLRFLLAASCQLLTETPLSFLRQTPPPAVLLPSPHGRKSISDFLIQRDLEIFCCGNLLPFITDLGIDRDKDLLFVAKDDEDHFI